MIIGISIVLILMIMGGLIAFLGDKIGSKVGKKRMSLFGLRPKYTSIIVTIISGTLIAFLTVAVLAVASENVRVALFGLNKLYAEMDQLSREIVEKNNALAEGQKILQERTREVEEMDRRTREISIELARAEEQRTYMESQLAVVQRAYDEAQANVNASAEEIRELEKTRQDLVDTINRLDAEKEILLQNIETIREGTVLFRAGQVIYTAVMEENLSDETVAVSLAGLLNDINTNLRERLHIDNENAIVVRVQREDFASAVEQLSDSPVEKLIRVTAAENIILGESTIVDFDIHDYQRIYSEGEIIFQADMDRGGYENYTNNDVKVVRFLQEVNAAAAAKGVLQDPITGSIGQLESREMLDVIEEVKKLGGRCRLIARAKRDIYTSGPLFIDVDVRAR